MKTTLAIRLDSSYCDNLLSELFPPTWISAMAFLAFPTVAVTSVAADIRTSTSSTPFVGISVDMVMTFGRLASKNLKPGFEHDRLRCA